MDAGGGFVVVEGAARDQLAGGADGVGVRSGQVARIPGRTQIGLDAFPCIEFAPRVVFDGTQRAAPDEQLAVEAGGW